jgi:hypothetical protein
MPQQKTLTDSFENLTKTVANTVKPISDEAGKMVETAKSQIAGDSGTSEQGQQGAANAQQTAQLKQQEEMEKQQKLRSMRQRLMQMVQAPARKPEKSVQEKKEEEKKVEQFKLQEKKRKQPKPISVDRAQTGTEKQRGATG